jgi:hypothetical protein
MGDVTIQEVEALIGLIQDETKKAEASKLELGMRKVLF